MYTYSALVPTLEVKKAVPEGQLDTSWCIESEADRLLASPAFRTCKRLSTFLRFIVGETLANGGCNLKERIIGVHVFGRA